MLIPLMPVDVPLWMVQFPTIFAVIIGKEVFEVLPGTNILNPVRWPELLLVFCLSNQKMSVMKYG
jgi:Na+-translocating ferredoxin:NAD+ oxidoreductase RnfD subunit